MMSISPGLKDQQIVFEDSNNGTSQITKPENWSYYNPLHPPVEVEVIINENTRRILTPSDFKQETLVQNTTQIHPCGPKSPCRSEESQPLTSDEPSCSKIHFEKSFSNAGTLPSNIKERSDNDVVPHNQNDHNPNQQLTEESFQLTEHVNNINSQVNAIGTIDEIVRAVKCQINVRKNGDMEVVVDGDEDMSRKLQNLLRLRLPHILPPCSGLNIPPGPPTVSSASSHFKMSHLNTIYELEALESQLKEPTFQRKMKENIVHIGGKTGQHSIRRTLRYLMTDDLAKLFSWSGRDGKRNFKDLTLTPILIETILHSYPTSTALHLENAVKSWLKLASHRQQMQSTNT